MTSLESYQMCPGQDLQRHLLAIDEQCNQALEVYKSLLAQRSTVLEALGATALQPVAEVA